MQDPKDVETINLIKGAIVYSDAVTTVSPTYAQEVKTPEGGKGLDNVLQQYSDKFSGILNGLDYSYWNPEIDRYLPAHFSARELPKSKSDICTLDKKAFIKRCLREKLLLEEVHRPIFAFIARLVPQKGIEMIERIIPYVVDNGGQFILLGTSPIPEIHQRFQHLKHYYQDNPHIHLTLHYNEELAHMIYAGSDMFFVPSIFEPCGLTQMIALKYGSIPVVRKTGGLADTIFDVEDADKPFEQRNGFVFGPPNSEALAVAVKRSLAMWFHEPEQWRRLMIHGMNIDFSWNLPADAYLKIYHSLSAKS
jgi:starch synthase